MEKKSEKEIREHLRLKLPHGSIKEIAEMANVARSTAVNFFLMKNNNIRVEYAALRYLSKMREERKELYEKAGFSDLFIE